MSAVQAGQVALAAIGLVVSAIGVFYYLNIIALMYFKEPLDATSFDRVRGGGARIVAIIAAIVIVVLGLIPIPGISPRPEDKDIMPEARDLTRPAPTRTMP